MNDVPETRASTIVHLRGEQSGGQLALVEHVVGAGSDGPPLHVHPSHAEGFYVLAGELTSATTTRGCW